MLPAIDPATLTLPPHIAALTPAERRRLLKLKQEKRGRQAMRLFHALYPDEDTPWRGPSIQKGLIEPWQTMYARHKYPKHMEFFEAGATYRERCAMCANRIGKALRHGTPIATPSGWVSIEALQVGDEVIAGDGTITQVTGVFPQGERPLYRLTFDLGQTIDADADHLWAYQHPKARYPYRGRSAGVTEANPRHGEWSVGTTAEILAAVGEVPGPRMRAIIPTSEPWQLPARPVPLDPYLVGILLGDGCLRHGRVGFSSADKEIVVAVAEALPIGLAVRSEGIDHFIVKPGGLRAGKGGHAVLDALRELGMMEAFAHQKSVPELYRLNDVSTRLALLQGLMDSDGSISATSAMEFSSTSEALAVDVAFLVTSMGGKAVIDPPRTNGYTHNGERREGRPSFRVRIRLNLCPFRLRRKAERWHKRHNTHHRVLHRIEQAEPGLATCISVAHTDRTYVTAHGIVTHNTLGMGGYEMACHLTGLYPSWWKGRVFRHPVSAWAAGKGYESTRDIMQLTLLGQVRSGNGRKVMDGRGIIPGRLLSVPTWKSGVADLVDTILVQHVPTGGWSDLGFKSYEQGRGSFEGVGKHVIWDDEEPPMDVYGEQLMRTATVNGIILITFTPLGGMSEVVLQFMPADQRPDFDDET